MFTTWLDTRSTRSLKTDRFFRPCLESLEERNAPSGHGHDGGDDQGDDNGHHAPPPTVPVSNSSASNSGITSGINAQGSFNNSTITGSFNNTINYNVTVNLPPAQAAEVQVFGGVTNLLATALHNPTLGTLLNDEITAAVDTYLTSPAISPQLSPSVVSILKTDLGKLDTAIATLEGSSPVLSALGTDVFNVTLSALVATQNKI
jgi:hypothetical protein